MKKLAAFVLAALLLAGCAPAEPEETTTAPTTQATTAPTTEPVTEPTAAPTTEATTEATEPVPEFTASLWRMEPEYLSYKAYFSQDRPYIKEQVNGWAVTRGDTGYFIELHADSALRISCQAFEETYTVPGSGKTLQDYGGPQLLGTDGKYAYLASDTHIVRVELLTGAVTELVSSGKIQNPYLCNGVVLYYIRYEWGAPNICRMYLPEMREDILRILEKPVYEMRLRRPESSQGDVIWTGYNPELIAIFEAEVKNPNSSYQNIGNWNSSGLWKSEDPLNDPGYYVFRKALFVQLQNDTGVDALFKGVYDCFKGEYTESTGPRPDCCYGTGLAHNHFGWEVTEKDPPKALDGQWQPIAPAEGEKVESARVREVRYGENGIYCVTEDNAILRLGYDGGAWETLYTAQFGQLRELYCIGKDSASYYKFSDSHLYVADGDKIVKIDAKEKRFSLLVEQECVSELWLWDDGRVYFAALDGMFYEQYIFDPEKGSFEETSFV